MKARREATGITAASVAEQVGVQPLAVYRWEAGDRVPDVATQVRIAEVLGTTVTELFPRTPDEADLAQRCTGSKRADD